MDDLKLQFLEKASITEYFPDGTSAARYLLPAFFQVVIMQIFSNMKELVNGEMNYQINKRLERMRKERIGKETIENDKKQKEKEEKVKNFLKTREDSLR